MNRAVAIGLFLLPGLVHAVICKTVDAEGVVAYMELPADECRTRVELPEYSRYSPRPIRDIDTPGDSGAGARQIDFSGYKELRIVTPVAGDKIRGHEGRVPLVLALQPQLRPGHRIHVYLDDTLILGSFDGMEIELSGVDSGSHEVRFVVLDGSGKRMITSDVVRFVFEESGQIESGPHPTTAPSPEPDSV
jgi:hypothetical protein